MLLLFVLLLLLLLVMTLCLFCGRCLWTICSFLRVEAKLQHLLLLQLLLRHLLDCWNPWIITRWLAAGFITIILLLLRLLRVFLLQLS